MGVMPIDKQEVITSIGFPRDILIELFDSLNANGAICPSLYGMSDSVFEVSCDLVHNIEALQTHTALLGLSCFHFTWYPFPLNITVEGIEVVVPWLQLKASFSWSWQPVIAGTGYGYFPIWPTIRVNGHGFGNRDQG